MKTRLTLRPGQNGTKKLVHKYGPRLIAVRYRYDERRQLRIKTVELVEEEFPWMPSQPAGRRAEELVSIRIGPYEGDVRASVKRAGGRWLHDRKTWQLPWGVVYALGLQSRLVD